MNIDKALSCGITCEQLRKLEHITAETDKINKELAKQFDKKIP